jgi:hypothetical protein
MVVKFGYQGSVSEMTIWTDTDFAGCMKTRKSTSGGVAMFGSHLIKTWCSTQAIVALSSGEAEYYGVVKGSSIGIGLKSMWGDFGVKVTIKVNTDASAARGIANRKGLGKVRHIAVNQLWIQDRIARGDLEINKVNGKENLADILTKHVNSEDIRFHLFKTGQSIQTGRHEIAPEGKERVNKFGNVRQCSRPNPRLQSLLVAANLDGLTRMSSDNCQLPCTGSTAGRICFVAANPSR